MKNSTSATSKNIQSTDTLPTVEAILNSQAAATSGPLAVSPLVRATNGYDNLSLDAFVARVALVSYKMAGNTNFTALQNQVNDITDKLTTFNELVAAAAGGGKTAILIRDTARAELTELMHTLGVDVTAKCNGNVTMFSTSGFKYTQPPKPTPPLEQPVLTPVRKVGPNQIRLRTKMQKGMTAAAFYIATDPAGEWTPHVGNRITITFDNLTRGQAYYIKLVMSGVKNQKVTSEVITAYAA